MIEEPKPLTIKKNWKRPSKKQLKAFENIPTGFVTDALNGEGREGRKGRKGREGRKGERGEGEGGPHPMDWTIRPEIGIGIGVVDIKVNHIETPDEIAKSIENAEAQLGEGRVKYIHPDCGFWMLKRSVADRKIATLTKGRDLYLGI